MTDCFIDPKLIAASGPFMGAALLMTMVQMVVVFAIQDRRARIILLFCTFAVQAIALLGGMAITFLQ